MKRQKRGYNEWALIDTHTGGGRERFFEGQLRSFVKGPAEHNHLLEGLLADYLAKLFPSILPDFRVHTALFHIPGS
jgi:hypothetical protein